VFGVKLRETGNDIFASETANNAIIPDHNQVVAQVQFPCTKAISVLVLLQLSQCDL
jgi:hypothetical protein